MTYRKKTIATQNFPFRCRKCGDILLGQFSYDPDLMVLRSILGWGFEACGHDPGHDIVREEAIEFLKEVRRTMP